MINKILIINIFSHEKPLFLMPRNKTFYFNECRFSQVCGVTPKYTHKLKKALVKLGLITLVDKTYSYKGGSAQEFKVNLIKDVYFVKEIQDFSDYITIQDLIESKMSLNDFRYLAIHAETQYYFIAQLAKLESEVFYKALSLGCNPFDILEAFAKISSVYGQDSNSKAINRIGNHFRAVTGSPNAKAPKKSTKRS